MTSLEPGPRATCPQCGAPVDAPTVGPLFPAGMGPTGFQSCRACGARWPYRRDDAIARNLPVAPSSVSKPRRRRYLPAAIGIALLTIGVVALFVLRGADNTDLVTALGTNGRRPPQPVLHQLSVAELTRFAPGGVDASKSADPDAAPLLCGGSVPSHLAGATIVRIPNTLSQASVLDYRFPSTHATDNYFDALRSNASKVRRGSCTTATPEGGVFTGGFLIAFDGDAARAGGTTTFQHGVYAGAYQYNLLRFVPQGRDVYLLRLDKEHDSATVSMMNALENAMNTNPKAKLGDGPHSAKLDPEEGTLQRGTWQCCSVADGFSGAGPWTDAERMTCPEVVLSGTHFTVAIENELPNVQPDGLVTFSSTGPPKNIPWGAHVRVVTDTFDNADSFGCQAANDTSADFARAVSVTATP